MEEKDNESVAEVVDDTVLFLDSSKAVFELSENGFMVKMTYDGEVHEGISAIPAFPLSCREELVHIYKGADSSKLKNCLGLIEDIGLLNEHSQKALSRAIQMSCMMPTITRIVEIKDEYYNFYWIVETDRGELSFNIGSPRSHVSQVSNGALLIKDLKDDLYYIPDPTQLDDHSRKQLVPII